MQTKETTVVELTSSLDEVNNMLVGHIQKQYGMRIDNISIARDGVITFTGSKSKDLTQAELIANQAQGDSLADGILGNHKERKPRSGVQNLGLTDFIRDLMKTGQRLSLDHIWEQVKAKGFDVKYKSGVGVILRKTLHKMVEEVTEGNFQIRQGKLQTA